MKTYKGFNPTPQQIKVIQEVLYTDAKYITTVSPRQAGKTMLSINMMLYFSINDPGTTTCFISPIYSQARKVMEEMYDAIKDTDIVDRVNFSNFEIKLKTGSKILFKSAEREDGLRGYTFDYLILDEASYIKEDAWKRAIQPTVFIKGKKVLLFSTPRGRDWFYNMHKMGSDPAFKQYSSCRMTYQGNPYVNIEEIESAKLALPEAIFRAEYEGEFLEGESMVFKNFAEGTLVKYPKPVGKVFAGLDTGQASDYTVCTFVDSTGAIVDIYRDNKKTYEEMTNQVLSRVKKWNASLLVETNSIGGPVFEALQKQWQDTLPFNTSNSSKREIIESLILAFNESSIRIPSIELEPELHKELEVFEMTYNPKTRTVQYAARTPFHDDMVMSLAIAWYHKLQNKSVGQYVYLGKR
jgi:hypothetical protein